MGIIVSWINAIWSAQDAQLSPAHDALSHLSQSSDRRSLNRAHSFDTSVGVDILPDEAVPLSPLPFPSSEPLSSAPATSTLDPSVPLSPVPPPSPSNVTNNNQYLFVSSDYGERARSLAMASSENIAEVNAEVSNSIDASGDHLRDPLPEPSAVVNRTSAPSPPPLAQLGLRIDVAAANDPAMDREIEMVDASFVTTDTLPDPSADMCFDDDGLTALEKIYLFARSSASFHRAFIARSLPEFLPGAIPSEAVEYVIPLMNGLAMDEDEAVKEALVEDLVSSVWWFLTHCQVVDFEVPEETEPRDIPFLYVQSFTPLLGTLLLNTSANVGAPARRCVVSLLMRIREADAQSDNVTSFGPEERRLFERELIQQVVIGMAHLDNGSLNDVGGQVNDLQSKSMVDDVGSYSSAADNFRSPPPSASDDEVMLSTLTSAALALATEQFLAEQNEPASPDSGALAATIQRPPSPLPSASPQTEYFPILSDIEPEFAHIKSQSPSTAMSSDPPEQTSPMAEVRSTSEWDPEPSEFADAARKLVTSSLPQMKLETPQPQRLAEFNASTMTSEDPQPQAGGDNDLGSDFNEEQAAIGRLASMSLIAAVTASGQLDHEYELAFIKEVERAGHDSLYWVRREATFALGALAKVVPEKCFHLNLLPLFEFFCDDSVWNVRQSILFALPAVLSRLHPEMRRKQALHTILKLVGDPASQVRTGVLEVLGETIYSFNEDPKGPPEEIVRLFIGEEGRDWHAPESPTFETFNSPQSRTPWANSMMRARISSVMSNDNFGRPSRTSASSSSSSSDSSSESNPARPLVCAFNLPAVILTLGPARWPELRGLHFFLSRTGASKVRQTLAASIGEIARIIGPENSRSDLIYRWWDFVRGHDAAVRAKALEALEIFLQALDQQDRTRLVNSLEEIWDNHLKRWREREVLARALARLAPYFPSNGQSLRTLLGRALRDETSAVRTAAVEVYPQIYDCVSAYPEVLRSIVDEILSLAYDEVYKKRLTYVACEKALIAHYRYNERIMDDDFWEAAVALAHDKIVDVRIGLARLMSLACEKIISQSRTLPASVLHIVRALSEDSAGDVRDFVSHILTRDVLALSQGVQEQVTATSTIFSRPPPKRRAQRPASVMEVEDTFRSQEEYSTAQTAG